MAMPRWTPLGWRARRYLERRGISAEQAAALGIVEMEERMRVVVPYRYRNGSIIYWNARSYSDLEEGPKYLAASGKHPLYVLPQYKVADTLVLVEGVFDAISVAHHTGHTVAAVGGKALPSYLVPDVLDLCRRSIVLLLDGDALSGALTLKRKLETKRQVRIVPLPVGEDPASLGAGLRELL
jgi:DNA primase